VIFDILLGTHENFALLPPTPKINKKEKPLSQVTPKNGIGSFDTSDMKEKGAAGERVYHFEAVDILQTWTVSIFASCLCSNVPFPFKLLEELNEICGFAILPGVIDESVRPGFTSTQVAVKELNRGGIQGDKEWLVSLSIEIFPLI
jgi:hypothetical protein